mgnify:CR=1 FL=1|tara:strand:- start:213 stop:1829 length:1617 start_codon:yes stop_codon:yes gene_type:complete
MGLISGKHQSSYYKNEGDEFGSYQFISLEDIIAQFQIAYVGEDKIIPKVLKADIAFHAQRALAELSFDTFKSIKAQEITLPPSLTMILPQDYVNYTRVSWVDSAGMKHPLVKTSSTSNPFSIKQEENGDYFFENQYVNIINGDFDQPLSEGWSVSPGGKTGAWDGITSSANFPFPDYIYDTVGIVASELEFAGLWQTGYGTVVGKTYGAWQRIDVSNARTINLSANGQSAAQTLEAGTGTVFCDFGILRIGFTTTNPAVGWLSQGTSGLLVSASLSNPVHELNPSPNQYAEYLDLGYLEWDDGSTQTKELEDIDVTALDEVWVYVQSQAPWTAAASQIPLWSNDPATPKQWSPNASTNNTPSKNKVDSVMVTIDGNNPALSPKNLDRNSNAFTNYKSANTSENNSDDYQDDTYWPLEGSRYGLDPQHAQANGSFYVDDRFGKINFSSNISGKTVILDYISDSLGKDGEMQVHKFAEEAMYKCIAYAILSTRSNVQEYIVRRFKQERFAAVRTAKLRLSNIKLDELTQILRGKSKQIKH